MDLRTFARLTRIEHAFMIALAAVIGEIVAANSIPAAGFLAVSCLVPFFICLASFALNDLLDVESDRINKRADRPLVSGEASRPEALASAVLGFLAGNLIAYFISPIAFLIAFAFSLLAILYDAKLKDLPLAGNLYIAATMAIPFIYGAMIVANGVLSSDVLVLSAMAFVIGLGREFMGTARDVKGDREARKASTLPMMIGVSNTLVLASLLYLLAIVISYIPYFSPTSVYAEKLAYALPITLANALFAFAAYKSLTEGERFLRRARNISLLALGIGLLGFLAGAVL
ncbi:Digeranylgeranylglyceryl phosphate synthase [Candidatus Burarchaeum australiense]|nr:Digeranylgeranylglyceryl phosphate synthase [Candidatus Burarchaeum australiense]